MPAPISERQSIINAATSYPGFVGQIVPIGHDAYALPFPSAADELPVPPKGRRLGYADTEDAFVASGRLHVATMTALLRADGFELQPGQRVLDFGCATGRMIRHLVDHAQHSEIWGADIHSSMISWCSVNLSPPFHFLTVTTTPHLPFEDNSFDLVYAGSVFTHIGELSEAWCLEIRRILKPGGRLWFTAFDEVSVDRLKTTGRLPNYLQAILGTAAKLNRRLEDCAMMVWRRNKSMQAQRVYYNRAFLSSRLSNWYSVKSVTDAAYGYQSAYLLQKRIP